MSRGSSECTALAGARVLGMHLDEEGSQVPAGHVLIRREKFNLKPGHQAVAEDKDTCAGHMNPEQGHSPTAGPRTRFSGFGHVLASLSLWIVPLAAWLSWPHS